MPRPAPADAAKPPPTAFRPPLYPVALWLAFQLGGPNTASIAALHLLVAVATILLVWRIGLLAGLGRAALLAALWTAVDPILLYQSAQVMTETLAALMAAGGVATLTAWRLRPTAWRAAAAGIACGASCLCRPTFLPWLVAVFIVVVFHELRRRTHSSTSSPVDEKNWPSQRGRFRRLADCLIFMACACATIAPWIVRNYRQSGSVIVATTHGGYTLLWGNNPAYYRFLHTARWGQTWDARQLRFPHELPLSPADARLRPIQRELVYDQIARQQAWSTIRAQPATFVHAALVRIGHLWRPWPQATGDGNSPAGRAVRWAIAAWYTAIYALAVAGLCRLGRRLRCEPWAASLLLCGTFTAVHALYWSDMRMRGPLMPVVYLVAAAGSAALIARLRKRN